MKILLANKFYYRRGGAEVYVLNLEELLKAHGHEVAVFSMQHPENLPNRWSSFWPSEIEIRPSFNLPKTLARPFGSKEVKRKFRELLDVFRPDVVHANNLHTHLSPVIMEMAKARGIRTVWTVHDCKCLCPRYLCLRNGAICESCFMHGRHRRRQDLLHCIRHKCMKDSFAYSLIGYLEALHWHPLRLQKMTDAFICPSQFMTEKMVQGGFSSADMYILNNFIDAGKCRVDAFDKDDYYCYVGRLSEEKGLKTLIKAANRIPQRRLLVIGEGAARKELQNMAMNHIIFMGNRAWEDIKQLVSKARFTVIPSEWYENCPLSVIESLCLGAPVLGAQIGGIPELIDEPSAGLTFESGNVDDLEHRIRQMFEQDFDYERIAATSRCRFDAETYYHRIINVYLKKSIENIVH